jgi:hypothetical protein
MHDICLCHRLELRLTAAKPGKLSFECPFARHSSRSSFRCCLMKRQDREKSQVSPERATERLYYLITTLSNKTSPFFMKACGLLSRNAGCLMHKVLVQVNNKCGRQAYRNRTSPGRRTRRLAANGAPSPTTPQGADPRRPLLIRWPVWR